MNNRKIRREQLRTIWAETPWDDIAAYIGPNAEKFRAVWEKQRATFLKKGHGIAWSFCWPAFFLSFAWFFYRKQWLSGAILIAIPLVMVLMFPTALAGLGSISIIAAMMAKSLYLQDAIPKVVKIRASTIQDAMRQPLLTAAGGVSKPAGIIAAIFLAAATAAAILTVAQ